MNYAINDPQQLDAYRRALDARLNAQQQALMRGAKAAATTVPAPPVPPVGAATPDDNAMSPGVANVLARGLNAVGLDNVNALMRTGGSVAEGMRWGGALAPLGPAAVVSGGGYAGGIDAGIRHKTGGQESLPSGLSALYDAAAARLTPDQQYQPQMNYPTADSEIERFARAQRNAQQGQVPLTPEQQIVARPPRQQQQQPAVSEIVGPAPVVQPAPTIYPEATVAPSPIVEAKVDTIRNPPQQPLQRSVQPVQQDQQQPAQQPDQPAQQPVDTQAVTQKAVETAQQDPGFMDKAKGWLEQLGGYFTPGGNGEDPQALHPAYGVPNAQVWEAQKGVLFNAGIMLMAAGMPNTPQGRAQIIAQMGPALNQTADQVIKVASAGTVGQGKMSNWRRMFEEAGGEQGTGKSFDEWMMFHRRSSNPNLLPPGAKLRDVFETQQAATFNKQVAEGDQLSGLTPDINRLGELYELAPAGKIFGTFEEIATMTPEGQEAMSIIFRLAPQFRVEGSGSTSDIEFAGMMESLGKLSNTREGNAAIIQGFRNYIALKNERANVIRTFMAGNGTYEDLQAQLMELNRRSILPDSLQGQVAIPRNAQEADMAMQQFLQGQGGSDPAAAPAPAPARPTILNVRP